MFLKEFYIKERCPVMLVGTHELSYAKKRVTENEFWSKLKEIIDPAEVDAKKEAIEIHLSASDSNYIQAGDFIFSFA